MSAQVPLLPQPGRVRHETSAESIGSTTTSNKRKRVPRVASRKASDISLRQMVGHASAIANTAASTGATAVHDNVSSSPGNQADPHDLLPAVRMPPWTVRHSIFLDGELSSCTTSTNRIPYTSFGSVLLREQIETGMCSRNNGNDAHFAARHAVLRFWNADGSLAEKWMDRDHEGRKEHEWALENLNDWETLHLAMGAEQDKQSDTDEGNITRSSDRPDHETAPISRRPTMDITAHYLSDYQNARDISSAPNMASAAIRSASDDEDMDMIDSPTSPSEYHWVEARRRDLEHQFRLCFSAPPRPTVHNGDEKGCSSQPMAHMKIGAELLPVRPKDLTDWSQMIAHTNRSMAASTLHLAAKLLDDQTRDQDRELAKCGQERKYEDDLGEVTRSQPILALMKPTGSGEQDLPELNMLA